MGTYFRAPAPGCLRPTHRSSRSSWTRGSTSGLTAAGRSVACFFCSSSSSSSSSFLFFFLLTISLSSSPPPPGGGDPVRVRPLHEPRAGRFHRVHQAEDAEQDRNGKLKFKLK